MNFRAGVILCLISIIIYLNTYSLIVCTESDCWLNWESYGCLWKLCALLYFLIERIELGCSLHSVYNSYTVEIPLLADFWLATHTLENLYSLAVMVSSVSSLHPAQVGMISTIARFFELWCRKCGGKGCGYRVLQGLLNPRFSFSSMLHSTGKLP